MQRLAARPAQRLVQQPCADRAKRIVSGDLQAVLHEVPACPLCSDTCRDGRALPQANLYSEQLALLLGCGGAELVVAVA